MAYIFSDIATFSGRSILTEVIGAELRSGAPLTVTDELISYYFNSLRITEQYPSRVQSVARVRVAIPEILRGMFTNIPV